MFDFCIQHEWTGEGGCPQCNIKPRKKFVRPPEAPKPITEAEILQMFGLTENTAQHLIDHVTWLVRKVERRHGIFNDRDLSRIVKGKK